MRVQVSHVTKSFDKTRALDNVSFDVEPGSIVALLGANGAGKTTLLRCLGGLFVPDRGEIRYDRQRFHRGRVDLRRRFVFLPDFPELFQFDIVRQIGLMIELYEADPRQVESLVIDLLDEFDLLSLAEFAIGDLSRGQTYKAALIGLLAVDPELWLLDEPFASGMDPSGITSFKRHAREASERGRIIIYSTQLLDVAERFADVACILNGGKLHAFGTLEQLRERSGNDTGVLEGIFERLRERGEER